MSRRCERPRLLLLVDDLLPLKLHPVGHLSNGGQYKLISLPSIECQEEDLKSLHLLLILLSASI